MNSTGPHEKTRRNIVRLIWLYFWLLLFEGALRKWVLPGLSNPLLIIRDPIVLLIYLLAIRARVFPKNGWVISLFTIGAISVVFSFVKLAPWFAPTQILFVSLYGFRSDFLHPPLIFVMANVLTVKDVKRFGWWTLATAVPMAMLMVGQFRAGPDAFLNRTAGGEGEMITSALGKVRTAATFSFVTGVVSYLALVFGFLIYGALKQGSYKRWLLVAAGLALAIGIVVSGSRSVVGACMVVGASLVLIAMLRPAALNRAGQALIGLTVLILIATQTPIFKEGLNVLTTRFNEAAEGTQQTIAGGAASRFADSFLDGLYILTQAPWLGYGLGIGTNAGAKFLTGRAMFLLSEGEWSRNFLEGGKMLGLAYVIWRCAIAIRIGLQCVRSLRLGNILSLLLFSSAVLPLLNGQFGQPTILGFAVFVSGLALAAMNDEELLAPPSPPARPADRRPSRIQGRSVYAERLHGSASPAAAAHTNGSADR